MFPRIQLAVLFLLLTSVAWCQEPQTPQSGDQQGASQQAPERQQPESQVTAVTQNIPGPVSGISPALAVAGEVTPSNVIMGSLGFTMFYDDNYLNNNADPFYDFLYIITPSIGFQQTRPRLQWSANYSGGVSVDQRLDNRNIVNHAATGNFAVALSQHVVLQLRETYAISSDPFFQAGQSTFVPAPSGPGTINPFVAVPPATSTSNISTADLSWQISPHNIVGVSGSYSTRNYNDVVTASGPVPQLIDTESRTGRAYFAHQVSRRQSVGVEFDVQDLRFSGLGRTISYGAFAFTEVVLRPGMKLSVYAGPQHSHVHDTLVLSLFGFPVIIPVLRDQWSPTVGGTFTWEGQRTALRLGAQSTVTDGGGLQGAVHSYSGTAEILRHLTPRWVLTAEGAYFYGRGIVEGPTGPLSNLRTVYGGAGIERKLTPNLSLRLRYQRLYQTQSGALVSQFVADHNRVEFGILYTFTHPWGG